MRSLRRLLSLGCALFGGFKSMFRKRILPILALSSTVLLALLLSNLAGIRGERQALFVAAADRGNIGAMRVLLAAGADINKPACPQEFCLVSIVAASLRGHD